MEIAESLENGVKVLTLDGRLDTNTSRSLEQRLSAVLGEEQARVLVDLAHLTYISSAGLRVFLMAAKQAKRSHGKLVLAALGENVREVFDLSGFTALFTVSPTRREGLAAF